MSCNGCGTPYTNLEYCGNCSDKFALRDALQAAMYYVYPDISRGPASKKWIETIQKVGKALGWKRCCGCKGTGWNDEDHDICIRCLATGYEEPEE